MQKTTPLIFSAGILALITLLAVILLYFSMKILFPPSTLPQVNQLKTPPSEQNLADTAEQKKRPPVPPPTISPRMIPKDPTEI